jgi:hypothetical protein
MNFGRWQDALADEFDGSMPACDAVITDPPFGKRTHDSKTTRYDGSDPEGLTPDFEPWTRDDVFEFVRAWSPACRGWICTMTSHDLVPHYEDAYREVDRFCFAPIPIVLPGMSVRQQADGPSSWSFWLVVARPRSRAWAGWGTLRGAYVGKRSANAKSGRGKPEWLLREIIKDYSRPGNLIVDPMMGWGSTRIAARSLGRVAIGCDGHQPSYDRALVEIAKPWLKFPEERQPMPSEALATAMAEFEKDFPGTFGRKLGVAE